MMTIFFYTGLKPFTIKTVINRNQKLNIVSSFYIVYYFALHPLCGAAARRIIYVKNHKQGKDAKTVRLVELALLTAIIAVMTFTPIGYLKLGPLELTLIMVPVIIGAVTLGPAAGAFLGLVFGASSFIQCFSLSAFGAILISISVFKTLVVCVVPRVLAGWLTGLIFNAVTKRQKRRCQLPCREYLRLGF